MSARGTTGEVFRYARSLFEGGKVKRPPIRVRQLYLEEAEVLHQVALRGSLGWLVRGWGWRPAPVWDPVARRIVTVRLWDSPAVEALQLQFTEQSLQMLLLADRSAIQNRQPVGTGDALLASCLLARTDGMPLLDRLLQPDLAALLPWLARAQRDQWARQCRRIDGYDAWVARLGKVGLAVRRWTDLARAADRPDALGPLLLWLQMEAASGVWLRPASTPSDQRIITIQDRWREVQPLCEAANIALVVRADVLRAHPMERSGADRVLLRQTAEIDPGAIQDFIHQFEHDGWRSALPAAARQPSPRSNP